MTDDSDIGFRAGVWSLGISAARLCSQAYTEAKRRFNAEPKKSGERPRLAVDIQTAKRDMDEAVSANRAKLKLVIGDKPWTPSSTSTP